MGFTLAELHASPSSSAVTPHQQPAAANALGNEYADWARGTSVQKAGTRRTDAKADRKAPKDEAATMLPAAIPLIPRRMTEQLAAFFGFQTAAFELAIAMAQGIVLEIARLGCFAFAVALWPARTRHEPTSPSHVEPAPAPSRTPANKRRNPSQAGSPRVRRRLTKVRKQDRAAALLLLLQRALAGGVQGIAVGADGRLRCTQRSLADLLDCGPGSINVALHWLAGAGHVAVFVTVYGTFIRVLPHPSGPASDADQKTAANTAGGRLRRRTRSWTAGAPRGNCRRLNGHLKSAPRRHRLQRAFPPRPWPRSHSDSIQVPGRC